MLFAAKTRPFGRHMRPSSARRSGRAAPRSQAAARGHRSEAPHRSPRTLGRRQSRSAVPVACDGAPALLHDSIRPTSVASACTFASIATHYDGLACGGTALHPHDIAAAARNLVIPPPASPPVAPIATHKLSARAWVRTIAASRPRRLARLSPPPTIGRPRVGRGRPAASSA
jgi:hypothetical protein